MHWSEIKAKATSARWSCQASWWQASGPIEPTALYIHAPVHRLAPRASLRAALTHMLLHDCPYGMLEQPGLRMAVQSAVMFHEEIAFVDYNGLAYDQSEGERLAQSLGNKSVLMMRNHGNAGDWQY